MVHGAVAPNLRRAEPHAWRQHVLPELAQQAEAFLKCAPLDWDNAATPLGAGHQVGDYKHLMQRVDAKQLEALFEAPLHPYTHGLLSSIPGLGILAGGEASRRARLTEIPGIVPALNALPPGCAFAPRCPHADAQCHAHRPPYEQKHSGHWAACWHSERLYGSRHA